MNVTNKKLADYYNKQNTKGGRESQHFVNQKKNNPKEYWACVYFYNMNKNINHLDNLLIQAHFNMDKRVDLLTKIKLKKKSFKILDAYIDTLDNAKAAKLLGVKTYVVWDKIKRIRRKIKKDLSLR